VTGVPRQYNIIELIPNHEDVSIQLNVRKDISQYGYDIPQWAQSSIGTNSLPVYKRTIHLAKPQIEYVVEEIDRIVRLDNNYGNACMRLKVIGLDNKLVLKYFDSYIPKVNDPNLLKVLLKKPVTIIQYMTALDAAVSVKDKKWIAELQVFKEHFQSEANPYVRDLENKAKYML
jgi:hypothetical protein